MCLYCSRAADDFADFLRNASLALTVVNKVKLVDHVAGIVGRILHRKHARGHFTGHVFNHSPGTPATRCNDRVRCRVLPSTRARKCNPSDAAAPDLRRGLYRHQLFMHGRIAVVIVLSNSLPIK